MFRTGGPDIHVDFSRPRQDALLDRTQPRQPALSGAYDLRLPSRLISKRTVQRPVESYKRSRNQACDGHVVRSCSASVAEVRRRARPVRPKIVTTGIGRTRTSPRGPRVTARRRGAVCGLSQTIASWNQESPSFPDLESTTVVLVSYWERPIIDRRRFRSASDRRRW